MNFKIKDNIIYVHSDSGQFYQISQTACTCKGFAYRRYCKHFTIAKEKGMIDQLKENASKKTIADFRKSPIVQNIRKKAIHVFLEKHNIKPTMKLINYLEPKLTVDSTPKKFLNLIKNF